ncbi:hypothetical protein Pmani_020974 [Petrolisthes manimaculis]|uniref:RRM domain-containing protein n=1 Tax=Petrolisthes manimaculis TaxID=1843537 RepID=A0AAE1PFS4_9EUCA|nr:hypothetical protein Pmani_020974 [Petrolisthes manimaculis]
MKRDKRRKKADAKLVAGTKVAFDTLLTSLDLLDNMSKGIRVVGTDVKEDDLESYFKAFGRVTCVNIMYDKQSGRHRGFAFVDFNDYDPVDKVLLTRNHTIKGRPIDVKKAISKSDISKIKSLMTGVVGGAEANFLAGLGGGSNDGTPASTPLPPPIGPIPSGDVKEDDLESYFKAFGRVTCVNIMYDKQSGRHRGFAFVDFNDYDPVDKVLLTRNHTIKGRPIDVKKAISKSDISKIKSLMTGVVGGAEANFLAGLGGGSNDGTPASTPLPPPIGPIPSGVAAAA